MTHARGALQPGPRAYYACAEWRCLLSGSRPHHGTARGQRAGKRSVVRGQDLMPGTMTRDHCRTTPVVDRQTDRQTDRLPPQ